MKKKIIGIILTVTMVLTLLPVMALPSLARTAVGGVHVLKVYKGEQELVEDGKNYYWEENELYILQSGLTVKGNSYHTPETINIGGEVTSITFENVQIYPDETSLFQAVISYSDNLTINLMGNNQFGDYINTTDTWSEKSVINHGIIAQNLTFTGSGNLTIYAQHRAIFANEMSRPVKFALPIEETVESALPEESEEPEYNITFADSFNGNIKIRQNGNIAYTIGKSEGEGESILPDSLIQTTALYANGDLEILSGTFDIVSYNGTGIGAEGNLTIGGDADVKVTTGDNSTTKVRSKRLFGVVAGEYFSIKDTAKVTILEQGNAIAARAFGDFIISSSNPISIKALNNVGVLVYGKFTVKESAKDVVLYGSNLNILPEIEGNYNERGAVVSFQEFDISKKLITRVGTVSSEKFNADDVKGELKVALVKMPEEPETPTEKLALTANTDLRLPEFYTCYVSDTGKVANALVIRAAKNPETADTSAMLIWAFAGLAALALAAGILVSRKQRD